MTTYTIDGSHSHASFTVRHLMVSNVRGEFQRFSGTVSYDDANPAAASVEVSLEAASISTNEEKRDAHLRSADFFDVEKFPTLTFKSTGAKAHGDGLALTGDLTIHGVTRSVLLTVEEITGEQKDPWGSTRRGAVATTKIKRSDFGLGWNVALEAGGILVGDDVKISLEVELIKQ